MELFSQVPFYTYLINSLFSIVAIGQGDVVVMGNPSNDRDTRKWKCEAKEHKWSKLQEEMYSLQENIIYVEALQEEDMTHGSLSSLVSKMTKLDPSLEYEKMHQTKAVVEAKSPAYEAFKYRQEDKES